MDMVDFLSTGWLFETLRQGSHLKTVHGAAAAAVVRTCLFHPAGLDTHIGWGLSHSGLLIPQQPTASDCRWQGHSRPKKQIQLQRLPAHFLSPGDPLSWKGTLFMYAVHFPQVKDMAGTVDSHQLLPVQTRESHIRYITSTYLYWSRAFLWQHRSWTHLLRVQGSVIKCKNEHFLLCHPLLFGLVTNHREWF